MQHLLLTLVCLSASTAVQAHALWQIGQPDDTSKFVLGPDNREATATLSGSSVLWDAVRFEAPQGVELGEVRDFISEASLRLAGQEVARLQLRGGGQTAEVFVPPVEKTETRPLALVAGSQTVAQAEVTLEAVRKWEVYILMHSHVDIGYTDIQPNIAKKQAWNVARALELIRQTKDYPAGSRFKWNLEVFWPFEQFQKTATAEQMKEFEQAVREGNIGVDAMYGNLLTGVCRGEELVRQFTYATALGRRCGVTVDSMMISDVPGLTWGIVPALAQNGVKYISNGPNANPATMQGDRIGYVRQQWEHRPFYWLSPSGREKALYWGAQGGYSIGHGHRSVEEAVPGLLKRLTAAGYPYDIVQLRWSKGDNGPADETVMESVRKWNEKHAYPRLIIATTSEAFHAFEKRYGDKLPTFKGDFTPYWEDGVGSGARETAMNRHSADRLLQAEVLWTLACPAPFPAAEFTAAWKNTAMWSEHTWGAYNSISQPDLPFVKTQWKYKQAYALDADRQSRELLRKAGGETAVPAANSFDVFNTASWPRTDLVTLSKETKGDCVKDDGGRTVPSQRLSTGELAFLAADVPAFGARRFSVGTGEPPAGQARAAGVTLRTPALTVKLDPASGAIVSLRKTGLDAELSAGPINSYVYLPGGNVKDAQPNGPATISIKESGPLVASLVAESDAPGCNKLLREVRLLDGLDRVEILNQVDKKAVRAVEGVHFGFAFNVPNPEVRINGPGAIGRPQKDQIPGACKNWFCVERWADVSAQQYGVTWVTHDAPLMELGGLTANLPRGQPDPNVYLKTIEPSATLYSWAMNNHWHTNYRADQEGRTTFRYAIQPHAAYDPLRAACFGVESTQPLLVVSAHGDKPPVPRLRIEPPEVIATALKPSDDGKAVIVRLWGASGRDTRVKLVWSEPQPKQLWQSDASERPLEAANTMIEVPAFGVVTLRAEMK